MRPSIPEVIPAVILEASKEALIAYARLPQVHYLTANIEKDINANLIAKIHDY